jgi:imidazolonepropionase-like amidohydrolase
MRPRAQASSFAPELHARRGPLAQSLLCAAFAGSLLGAAPSAAALQEPEPEMAPEPPPTTLIQAERVIARPGRVLEDVGILVRGSDILAVGPGLTAPEGATLVEAKVVCAGFLDPWSALGLDGSALNDRTTSTATRTIDAVDPYSDEHLFREVRAAGVTSVRVQAGLAGRIAGLGALVRTSVGPEDLGLAAQGEDGFGDGVLYPDAGVGVVIPPDDAFARIDAAERIVSAIESGAKYREAWLKYEADLAKWEKDIAEQREELEKDFSKAKKKRAKEMEEAEEKDKEFKEEKYKEDKKPRAPKFDRDDQVAARVADGEIPLFVEARRAAEIRELIHGFAKQPKVRWVLVGADEAGLFADELASAGVPVVVQPDAARGDARFASGRWGADGFDLAARLDAAGVEIWLGGGGREARSTRDLPLSAALAVGHGLDPMAALHALTLGPARGLDVSDRVGTVEVGKQADLLLLSGDPFDATTRVEATYVAGVRVYGE